MLLLTWVLLNTLVSGLVQYAKSLEIIHEIRNDLCVQHFLLHPPLFSSVVSIKSDDKESGKQNFHPVTFQVWASKKNYQSGRSDEGESFHLHPRVPFLDGPPRRRPTWGNGRGKGASGQSTVGRLQSSKEPSASEGSREEKETNEYIGPAQRCEVAKYKSFLLGRRRFSLHLLFDFSISMTVYFYCLHFQTNKFTFYVLHWEKVPVAIVFKNVKIQWLFDSSTSTDLLFCFTGDYFRAPWSPLWSRFSKAATISKVNRLRWRQFVVAKIEA